MSSFVNNSGYWPQQDDGFGGDYLQSEYNQFGNQSLDFKPFEMNNDQVPTNEFSEMYDPTNYPSANKQSFDDEDELPLLEELEIYPDRIVQKMLAVLNPFQSHGLTDDAEYLSKDPDLAGPILIYLILGMALFLSGKDHFGYIYGISVVSCLFMYSLLTLMTEIQGVFTVMMIASILGYSLIPVVGLSVISVFLTITGIFKFILASLAVIWSGTSASRLFVALSGQKDQQFLIAYPCCLISALYLLLVIF